MAGSNTYSVNLTLLDNKINQLNVKIGKTQETYKILVGEVSNEEIIENTEGTAFAAAGNAFTILLMNDGTIKTFGSNYYGELGILENSGTSVLTPVPTAVPNVSNVKAVSAGHSHAILLMKDGTVMSFGNNNYGELGRSENVRTITPNPIPTKIPGVSGVKDIATGTRHTLLLMNDGTVKAFGYNYAGQLGVESNIGTYEPNSVPTQIPGLSKVKAIYSGGLSNFLIMEDGTVMSFGYNNFGQLGRIENSGTTNANYIPTVIPELIGVKKIAVGGSHTLVLMNDGTVKSFGFNKYGQLGRPENVRTTTATPIPGTILNIKEVKDVIAGENHSILLMNDGTLRTFGMNKYGQLGYGENAGNMTGWSVPKTVPDITNVKSVVSGFEHNLLLMEDGSIRAFGSNRFGQLGTTININTSNPNIIPIELIYE